MKKEISNSFIDFIPLLSELSDQNKERIRYAFKEKFLEKGSILFIENEEVHHIYFLRKGKVRLSKSTSEGKELIIGIRETGDFFPKAALFRKASYPATAEVIEAGEAVIINNKDLEDLIIRYPDIGISIIQILGERLYEAHSKLRDVALYGKLGALASTLLRLAKDHGIQTHEGIKIDLSLTHQELANFIGSARENVNRMMSTLEKNGVLSTNRGEILIKEKKELEDYMN